MKNYNIYYNNANSGEIYMMTFFDCSPEKFEKVLKYFEKRNCKILKIEEI